MANDASSLAGVLNTIAHNVGIGGLASVFPERARSAGMEEVIIVYCKGWGKFSDTGPPFYINLEVDMYDFSGRWVGFQSGVNLSKEAPPASLKVPAPPQTPIDRPPVPSIPASSWTKGLFTFNDGAVIVQGPALTHLTPLKDGNLLFSVTTSHVITAGTGLYEGARGTKQATGTALVPRELIASGKFPSPGLRFPVTTIETFRLIRKQFLEAAASGGQPPPVEAPPSLSQGGALEEGPPAELA
jgi:hypothetical protein